MQLGPINQGVRELDRSISDLVLEYEGSHGFEDHLFLPTDSEVEAMLARIARQRRELAGAELHAFWAHHFDGVLRGLEQDVRAHLLYPYNYVHGVAGFLGHLLDFSNAPAPEKLRQAEAKVSQLPRVLEAVLRLVQPLPDTRRQQVVNSCVAVSSLMKRTLQSLVPAAGELSPGSLNRLEEQVNRTESALRRTLATLTDMPPFAGDAGAAMLPFEQVMSEGLQVPLEFILSWYANDFAQRREEFYELGARIDPSRDPFTILREDSPGYDDAPSLMADARRVVQLMREFALDYVTLPPGEVVEVGPVAEQSKMDCPTANCGGADMWTGTLRSRMGLNEDNYTAFNRASLWGTVAHECYPGHHANMVKGAAVDLPRTFRLYLPLVRAMVEGVAHRSEFLMAPHYEDDLARLSTAHRVFYCAARVKAEMDLNYHRRPAEELLRMYREELQVNEMTARLQVQAHLMYPGDATSYYTGARVLESRRQALGMDARSFTEPIFSYGFVSLSTMEQLVTLSAADGEAIKHFGSL